jgi:hypothetical protein
MSSGRVSGLKARIGPIAICNGVGTSRGAAWNSLTDCNENAVFGAATHAEGQAPEDRAIEINNYQRVVASLWLDVCATNLARSEDRHVSMG